VNSTRGATIKALRTAVVLILALALPACGPSTDLETGKEAYDRGDHATAMTKLRPLAEQGNADAQVKVGLMYGYGEGVTQDHVEAAKWYRRAAEQGHAFGQSLLGYMYEDGQGVPLDYVQAHMWFNLAAARALAQGENRDAAVWLRDNVEAKMTPDQIAEAQRLAREWKPK
jgi:TPR repeat protein